MSGHTRIEFIQSGGFAGLVKGCRIDTASLDAESGMQVTRLLKRLCVERGHTVVVVTHDNRIYHLADRIVAMEDGLIVPASRMH